MFRRIAIGIAVWGGVWLAADLAYAQCQGGGQRRPMTGQTGATATAATTGGNALNNPLYAQQLMQQQYAQQLYAQQLMLQQQQLLQQQALLAEQARQKKLADAAARREREQAKRASREEKARQSREAFAAK